MAGNSQFERGQGLIEYALIIVMVSVTAILILSVFGKAVGNVYSEIILHI